MIQNTFYISQLIKKTISDAYNETTVKKKGKKRVPKKGPLSKLPYLQSEKDVIKLMEKELKEMKGASLSLFETVIGNYSLISRMKFIKTGNKAANKNIIQTISFLCQSHVSPGRLRCTLLRKSRGVFVKSNCKARIIICQLSIGEDRWQI